MFAALGGNVKAQMALVIINNFSIINENTTLPGPVYLYEVSHPGQPRPAGIPSQAGLVQQQQEVPLLLLHLYRILEFYRIHLYRILHVLVANEKKRKEEIVS